MKNVPIGFILLHNISSNLPILIQKNNITSIIEHSSCNLNEKCSFVYLNDQNWFKVKESIDEILKLKETK